MKNGEITLVASAIPVRTNQSVVIDVWTSRTIATQVVVRVVQELPNGETVSTIELFNAVATTFPTRKRISLTDGKLLSVTCYTSVFNSIEGLIYCRIGLQTGRVADNSSLYPLTAGYLVLGQVLNYPLSPPSAASATSGAFTTELFSSPAPGADFSLAFGTTRNVEITAFSFTLTTDGTVSNRRVSVEFRDATTVLAKTTALIDQTASKFVRYFAASDGFREPDAAGNTYLVLPSKVVSADAVLATVVNNIQAADEITSVFATYRQSIVPA